MRDRLIPSVIQIVPLTGMPEVYQATILLGDVALGVAGIAPLVDYRGQHDIHGRILQGDLIALVDESPSSVS